MVIPAQVESVWLALNSAWPTLDSHLLGIELKTLNGYTLNRVDPEPTQYYRQKWLALVATRVYQTLH